MTDADFSASVQQPVNSPPTSVNLNDTGDSLLHDLNDFMDRLSQKNLGDIYQYWNQTLAENHQPSHTTPMMGLGNEESQLLPELRSMKFGYFDGAAKRLDNLSQSGKALGDLANGLSTSISQNWSDKAGQAASEKFGDLQKAAGDYQDTVTKLGAAMNAVWKTTRPPIEALGKFASQDSPTPLVKGNGGPRFMGLYGTGDKWSVGEWSNNIDGLKKLLQNTNPASQTTTNNNTNPDGGTGQQTSAGSNWTWPDLVKATDNDVSEYDSNADSMSSSDVIQKMNDFNNNYDSVVRNFRAQIQAAHDTVHNQMIQLQNTINGQITNLDPFGQLSVGAPPAAPGGQPSQSGGGTQTGGGHTSSGGSGSSGGTSASSFTPPPISPSTAGAGGVPAGGAPGGTGAMPTVPPISTPVGSTGTTTSSATGTGLPTTGTGQPGAGLPGTGTPLSGTGTPGSTPETLTVQSGGNTIGMSSPDSQGNVQLTVTNNNGQPQTYDIGFGQGSGATGTAGTPLQQPGAMPGGGGFGPTGTPMDPSQLAGGAGVQHITPGPDGSAVIHDGNLTITATEPQGHNGPVQVTVDDGTGHPSTYTLGGGDPTGGASQMQPLTGQPATDPSSLSGSAAGGGYTTGASGYGDPSSMAGSTTTGFTDPSTLQPDPGTSASAWLSPDAANQAHTAAAVVPDVGGTVSGHVGDASGLIGGGGGGGGGGGVGLAAMSGGSVGGSDIHSVLGGAVDHSGGTGDVSGVGLAGTDVTNAAAPGGAGLAAGPGGGGQASGGMPMMGGMGGMGGGGQGGDTERGASQWRTQGHLFDNVMDDNPASGFSGVLGEETREQGR